MSQYIKFPWFSTDKATGYSWLNCEIHTEIQVMSVDLKKFSFNNMRVLCVSAKHKHLSSCLI